MLLVRALPILGDRLFQVLVFFAGNQADFLQRSQVLLGFREVVRHQIRFADVLVRAAVPGVELERALVMLEREVELTRVPVGVAEIVLDIGIAGVAERRRGKRLDRGAPVLRLDRLFARGVVRIELRRVRIAVVRIGRRRARGQRQRDGEERAGDSWATI